jgi:tRNA pseudouridine32 synthase / 23S rRNA pseudouridine746 synthase
MMWTDRVLFLDGEALVIDKPAGLPVDAPRDGSLSLENHLLALRFGFERPPSPVHRLDRDTSGCLLLARNPKAHKRFSKAFEEGRVDKTYLAIVDGVPEAREGVIDMPLGKVSSREAGWRMVHDPRGRPSVSKWRVAGVRDGRAAILFTPETGRTHQLRVHAAEGLKLPISGDPVYGSGPSPSSGGPMLLHALSLRLERGAKPPVEAEAPLPPYFAHAGFGDVLG